MSTASAPPPRFSERLAKVCVGLRPELEVSRHVFRGHVAYLLRDPITFQTHQLGETDYRVVSALTPDRTLSKIYETLTTGGVLRADDEEEFYRFIVGLNQRGLLSLPVSDGQQLHARYERRKAMERQQGPLRYLFYRVPLLRPDDFLTRTVHWVRPLFTRTAFILWLIAGAMSLFVLATRWREFCDPLGSMLALQNLPLLWALLVGLKIMHEFGHAYACKHFGGRVPEMGAYFVLLTPCAYVDASAAWGFPRRLERIIVSLAGMYIESILAMFALVIWCVTEPSLLHSAAQYAIALSTVVTIGFNINPLMKYDGYFVLTDLLEMPNLAQQAKSETVDWLQRWLLGSQSASRIGHATRRGLIVYCLASSAYRVLVVLGICTMLSLTIPVAGVGLALFYAFNAVRDLGKQLHGFLRNSVATAPKRKRAIACFAMAALVVPALVLCLPVPWARHATGIVERDHDQVLHAETSGFVRELFAEEGAALAANQPIARLENVETEVILQRRQAEVERLRVQLQGSLQADHEEAAAVAAQLTQAERERADARRQVDALTLRAPAAGVVMRAAPLTDVGRYVHRGEPVVELAGGKWVIRALLNAEGYTSAHPQVGQKVRSYIRGGEIASFAGTIVRVAAAGDRRVDHAALTHLGGGEIAVHGDTLEAVEPFYEVTIALEDVDASLLRNGLTATVKFAPTREPLGLRIYRSALRFLNTLRASV